MYTCGNYGGAHLLIRPMQPCYIMIFNLLNIEAMR